jgi:acyl-CoA dehydrogenase
MSSGQVIGAIAITEPGGGSDVQSIQMSASRTPEGYSLRGQKVFVSNGQLADLVIVAAQTERGSGASGLTLFLVEGDRVGLRRGRNLEKIGLKAQDTSELFFDDVIVPERNVLGETGKGFIQLMTELAQERLIQAVRAVSTAEAAIDWTIDYTTQRRAFGRAIAEFQNTEFKLAELSSLITGQRVFADRCIELHLAHQLDAADAARLKLTSTELLGKVTDECLQLFGGWGYMWEYPIARAYADARQARIAAGSSEIMKQIIARDLRRRERHAK